MMHLEPFVSPPLQSEHLQSYAQASKDLNPIHTNPVFAAQSPHKGVIVHGMLSMGFLGQYIDSLAAGYHIETFHVRFQKVVHLGDVITCTATSKEQRDSYILLEVVAKNQLGEAVTAGEALLRRLSRQSE